MLDIDDVLAIAKTKILDLSYDISKKINMWKEGSKIEQAAALCAFVRVLEDTDSLLEDEEQQQILQGIITIGQLTI